jgi:hypothetical protein
MRFGLSAASAALVFVSGNALAGVIVTSTHIDVASNKATPSTIYAESDRMKVVSSDTTVIFRGDLNKAWVITPEKRTYMELTPETMRMFGGQIAGAQAQFNAAQAQLEAHWAQLPPGQRALVEAQLGGRGLGGPPGGGGPGGAGRGAPQVTYVKAGPGKTVGSWRCDMYAKTVGDQKEEDVCIAPIASTGLTVADFRVLESFASFIAPVASSPVTTHDDYMNWNDMNKAIGFQGVPLDTTRYAGGRPTRQETVQKIERATIPANTFDLPPGLTKQDAPNIR